MKYDVVIVGGGPAGMACALRLAQLIDGHNAKNPDSQLSKENIYVLEKARTQIEISEKAGALGPAAVILNINDESLDAFKALEALKGDARSKAIPVLAFANHEEVDNWKRAQQLGVTKIVSRNEFSSRTLQLVQEIVGTGGASSA
jgi:2-polyprenyl-6-methoxyphenol hydroxylase-like FAD-dependent oxidoreductase